VRGRGIVTRFFAYSLAGHAAAAMLIGLSFLSLSFFLDGVQKIGECRLRACCWLLHL